jgi:hypothetical protein
MIPFVTYHIEFRRNAEAEPQVRRYQATNPGSAIKKLLTDFRKAVVLRCRRQTESRWGGKSKEIAVTNYDVPPSPVTLIRRPKVKAQQELLPFMGEIGLSFKPKKPDRDAAHGTDTKLAA